MWRSALVIVAVSLVGLFLVRNSRERPLDAVEAGFVSWLAGNARGESIPAPLVFVEINESSLAGQPWPWSPFDYALFFQAVLPFGPAVIACEPILNWDAEGGARDPLSERILTKFLRRSPKVVLGARLAEREYPEPAETRRIPRLTRVIGDTSSLSQFAAVQSQPSEKFSFSAWLGFANLNSASRNWQVPLVFLYRGEVVPSFALQAMILWLKLTPDDVVVIPGKAIELGTKIRVPIDEGGMLRMNFYVPITRFGMDDLLLAAEQTEERLPVAIPVEHLRGNVVLLARTDEAAETITLPDGSTAAPGTVIAATIATMQNQFFIQRVGHWFDFALIGIFVLCGPLWIRLRPGAVVASSVALLAIYLFASLAIFDLYLIWLPLVLPTGLILFLTIYALLLPVPRAIKSEM